MWMCLNDGIIGASGLFLFLISAVVCIFFGFQPNILLALYAIIAAYCFLIAFTRFTSALSTVVPDFLNLLGIIMQLGMWATPIVWDISMLSGHQTITKIMECMPFTYLVTAYRNSFMGGNIVTQGHGIYTIVFWVITIGIFLWGNYIFKKSKKDFADVL